MSTMNKTLANGTDAVERQLFSRAATIAINTTYVLISMADIVCNIFVIILFLKNKRMRKPYHILLFNISLTDLLTAIAIQPYIWIDFSQIESTSAFASFLCAISVGLLFVMVCGVTNVMTLCAVTVLRYLGIVKEYRGSFATSAKLSTAYCLFAWLTGAATRLPGVFSFKYNPNECICYREWPAYVNGTLFSILTSLLFLVIPFALMTSAYVSLALHLWKRSKATDGSNIVSFRARKTVTLLLGLLMLSNTISLTPYFLLWLLGRTTNYFSDGTADSEYRRQRLLRIAMIFPLLNSVLDPFIYAFSSEEYRKGIWRMI